MSKRVATPFRNPKVLASLASGVLLGAGWLSILAGVPHAAGIAVYVLSLATGAFFFGKEALEELVREREVGIELLMLVAALAALSMGQAMEGAMLAFLYSISEAMEGYTEQKTRNAIEALVDLTPRRATVRRDGREVEISVEALGVGDLFLVRPGQAIPTDGAVTAGSSSVNQAPVTGESVPVEKGPGDQVFAGSINGQGSLDVRATATFANNTIARIVQMVEEAQERKGKNERFIERFGRRYSPLVLLAGVLVAIVPPVALGGSWVTWIARATVFVVAAAPCALVISIPITSVATLGTAARYGVLIKGGIFVEELARVQVVALDKTGTLTLGRPEVSAVRMLSIASGGLSEERVLAIAAGIERQSEHPVARAIHQYAVARGIAPAEVTDFQSVAGAGVRARVDGGVVHVGSPAFFEKALRIDLVHAANEIADLQQAGSTVVVLGDAHQVWALIAVRDNLRPNAREAIASLRRAGVARVVMLTGDNARAAQGIAQEAGVDEFHADLKPEEKAAKVRELTTTYGHLAMVGDGVNDAPALAEASVGVAMGAAGTDVALETADIALMGDNLERLAYAIRLSKRNGAVVRQNLALSILVIGALVVGAVAGMFTLPVAVVAHEVSEFIVIASGLRMLRG